MKTDMAVAADYNLEKTVLSLSASNTKALAYTMETLTEEDFYHPRWKGCYRTMQDMLSNGEAVDLVTLHGKIDVETGHELSPISTSGYVSHMKEYVAGLQELSTERTLRDLGRSLAESDGDNKVLLRTLDEGLKNLVRRDGYRSTDMLTAVQSSSELRRQGAVATKAVDYPWHKVNMATRGLRSGWLCYLAGRPGEGKTAAAIELAISAAKQGKKVLFNSLEMDSNELAVRVVQRYGLNSENYYMGEMTDGDWKAFLDAGTHEDLKNIKIETAETIAKLVGLVRAQRPDLIIVDYVQLMDHADDRRVEGTTKTSNALKRMARRYEAPVVALSQLSRTPKDPKAPNANPRPNLSDLRDSGSLEQDADQVIFIHRDRDNVHNIPLPEGRFIVGKARMGTPAIMEFQFDGPTQQFHPSLPKGESYAA